MKINNVVVVILWLIAATAVASHEVREPPSEPQQRALVRTGLKHRVNAMEQQLVRLVPQVQAQVSDPVVVVTRSNVLEMVFLVVRNTLETVEEQKRDFYQKLQDLRDLAESLENYMDSLNRTLVENEETDEAVEERVSVVEQSTFDLDTRLQKLEESNQT